MLRKTRIVSLLTLAALMGGMGFVSHVEAKGKKASSAAKDPDAPSNEQAKVLGWGPVQAPNRAKNPEYLVRGVLLDIQDAKDANGKAKKGWYTLKILPIEVLENYQRAITEIHMQSGLDVTLKIPADRLKELKQGRLLEYHQYYTEKVEETVGGARMVAMTYNQDIQGYPAGPGAYLKKPGFYPIQYKNALKGVKLYLDNIKTDKDVQAHLDYLATKSKDPELQSIAKNTYVEIYQGEPSGKCTVAQATSIVNCK